MSNISINGSDVYLNRAEIETDNDITDLNHTETEIPQNPVIIPNTIESNHSDNPTKSGKQVNFLNFENKLVKNLTTPSENDENYQNSSIGIPEINFEMENLLSEQFLIKSNKLSNKQIEPNNFESKIYSLISNINEKPINDNEINELEKKENFATSRIYELESKLIEMEKKMEFENLSVFSNETKVIEPKISDHNENQEEIDKENLSKNSSESENRLVISNHIIKFQDFKSDHSEIKSRNPQKFNNETLIINETLLFNEKDENQINLQDKTINIDNVDSIITEKQESIDTTHKEVPSESLHDKFATGINKTLKSDSETIEDGSDIENELIKINNSEENIENKIDHLSLNFQDSKKKFDEFTNEKTSSEKNIIIRNLSINTVESQTGPIKTNNASQATWIQNKGIQANFSKNSKSLDCCHRRCIQFGTVITVLFFILGYLMRDFIDNLILYNC